jgi:hypothetical protein
MEKNAEIIILDEGLEFEDQVGPMQVCCRGAYMYVR